MTKPVRDYLIHVANLQDQAAVIAPWIGEDGQPVLPEGCQVLGFGEPLIAYSDLGDGDTVPPTPAPGRWFIITADDPLPPDVAAFVVAEASREEGLTLPTGVVGLSTMWAGMKVKTA